MGTSNSKKKSIPDSEQKIKKAENLNNCAAPQNPMPDMKQSSDWKPMTYQNIANFQDPQLKKLQDKQIILRMKTGRNGIDVFQNLNYEENDIKTVKQAVQCS